MELFNKIIRYIRIKYLFYSILFTFLHIHPTFAYIDPGTGSFILQAILGAIAAITTGISFYWNSFKKILKKFKSTGFENNYLSSANEISISDNNKLYSNNFFDIIRQTNSLDVIPTHYELGVSFKTLFGYSYIYLIEILNS